MKRRMIFSKNSVICMAMLLAAVSLGSDLCARSEKSGKQDPVVGVYLLNFTPVFYAVISFQAGGTTTFLDSVNIEQPFPPLAPAGFYGTPSVGVWKKICKGRYTWVDTGIINTKDITTRNECGDLLLAGIPFTRAKAVNEMELSEDGKFITGSATVTFYEVDDVTLTKQLPIPPLKVTFSGQRLEA